MNKSTLLISTLASIFLLSIFSNLAQADWTIGQGGSAWSGNSTMDYVVQDNSGKVIVNGVWYESFNNRSLATINSVGGWTAGTSPKSIVVLSGYSGKGLELNDTGSGSQSATRNSLPKMDGNFTDTFFIVWFNESTTTNEQLDIILREGTSTRIDIKLNNGQFKYLNNSGSVISTSGYYQANTWNSVKIKFNMSAQTASYWLNDTLLASDVVIRTNGSYIDSIQFLSGDGAAQESFIDEIRFWNSTYGNITAWYDASVGNETYKVYINATTQNNTNYTVLYRQNGTSTFTQLGVYNGSNNISITGITYQKTDIRVVMNSNETVSPEISSITFYTRSAPIDYSPNVTLNSPSNNFNQTPATILFNCTAYDDINLTNVTLYNNLDGTWQANGTNSSGINNTEYIFTRTTPTNGTFIWNCLVYDNSSQSSFASQNYTITVDEAPPTSNSPSDASYSQGASATIGWLLFENYVPGYYIVYRNGTIQNQSTWANNTNLNVWINTSTQGTWNYTIIYNDSLGNNGVPDTVLITVSGDTTTPTYSSNSTSSTIAGASITHNLYWTDDVGLSGFIFSFDNGNGTFINNSWASFTGIGNWSNVTKTVNSTSGATIRWKIYANDTSNNWNVSANHTYTTSPQNFDNDPNIFWVRTDGNDSCSGQNNMDYAENSTSCAWKTMNHSISSLTAGDILNVVDGIWFNEPSIDIFASGTPTDYITIQKYSGTPTLTQTSNTKEVALTLSGDYIKLDGIKIDGIGISKTSGIGITITGTHNIVTNSIVYNSTYSAISVGGSFNVLNNSITIGCGDMNCIQNNRGHDNIIQNSVVHTVLGKTVWNGTEWVPNTMPDYGISVMHNDSYNVLVLNTTLVRDQSMNGSTYARFGHGIAITGTDGATPPEGPNNVTVDGIIALEIGDAQVLEARNGATNIIFKNGYITNQTNTNGAIYLHGASNYIIVDNITVNGTRIGFSSGGSSSRTNASTGNIIFKNSKALNVGGGTGTPIGFSVAQGINVSVINSVMMFSSAGSSSAIAIAGPSKTSTHLGRVYKNNIVSNWTGSGIQSSNTSTVSYTVFNNISSSDIIYNANYGAINGMGNLFDVDPLFVDPQNGDFHLKSQAGRWNGTAWVNDSVTSPAIDAGDPSDDYSLEPTPNGGRINMGVYGNTVEESKSPIPFVSLNNPSDAYFTNNQTILFNCSASSTSSLVNITLYNNWSGTWASNGTANISGTSNYSAFTRTFSNGSYLWSCLVYDSAGNASFALSNYTFTVDTISPVLTFIDPTPNNAIINESYATINISSDETLLQAILEWNGTNNNTMQDDGTNWYYNKTELSNGNYTFKIYASDPAGNWNNTETRWFYINYTASCTESWSYSDWSACSASTQTRTATDANSCGTTVNQSALSQSCTPGTTPSSGGGGGGASTTTKTITVTPFDPLTKVVVNLKQSLDNPSLTIVKVESVPVSAPSGSVYHYINITKNKFNNSNIDNATIDFKVNKSWIISNNFTRIWLAHYDNGWNNLKTDLTNSTATANYYRAYTSAFSYFAIVGEKAEAAQTAPPIVETPNETIKEKTATEQPKESGATIIEEPKATNYTAYTIAIVILLIAAYAAMKMKPRKESKAPRNESVVPELKAKYSAPLRAKNPEIRKAKIAARKDNLDDVEKRLDAIRKKLKE